MDFDDYQREARKTAIYPRGISYPLIGLAGEVGELCNTLKKCIRDDGGQISCHAVSRAASEVGDILWYLAMVCDEMNLTIGSCAEQNIEKLRFRSSRGTISGSGEDR